MRAITVRQPWAWAIMHGGKDVENRSRNIAGAYRGPVAIHAGLAPFEQDNMASRAHRLAHGGEVDTRIVFGAIVGVVDLVDAHPSQRDENAWTNGDVDIFPCSPWAEWHGPYHLVLTNPCPLRTPIPVRGRLGLWTLPDDVAAQVEEALR